MKVHGSVRFAPASVRLLVITVAAGAVSGVAVAAPPAPTGTVSVFVENNVDHAVPVSGNVNVNGTVDVVGDVSVVNTVDVAGDVTVLNTVDVAGDVSVLNTVDVAGTVDIGNTVVVTDATHPYDASFSASPTYFIPTNSDQLNEAILVPAGVDALVIEHLSGTIFCGDPQSVISDLRIEGIYVVPEYIGVEEAIVYYAFSQAARTYVPGGEQVNVFVRRTNNHTAHGCQVNLSIKGYYAMP